ncbi:MAG: hypothetical protein AB7Q27_12110 [Acidimicrobiia bacterium]
MQSDELIAQLAAVSGPLPDDRAGLIAGLCKIRSLRSALDAIELRHVVALAAVSPTLEGDIAGANRVSIGNANRIVTRAKLAAQVPEIASALADGDISAAHIDTLADVIRREEPATQRELIARSAELARTASGLTVGEFRKAAIDAARQISRDNGTTRADRQRRDTTCRTRLDDVTGMWHINATFDPELAVRLKRQLDAALERRYHDTPPASAPSDPVAKQDHLRALALADLMLGRVEPDEEDEPDRDPGAQPDAATANGSVGRDDGVAPDGVAPDRDAPGGAADTDHSIGARDCEAANARAPQRVRFRPGPPEVLVLWDVTKPIDQVDWGLDVDIPPQALADLIARVDIRIHNYLMRDGLVVDAPGELALGRTTRLANRAQRRALRAMYRTCAIPGCTVAFDQCKIHHVIWWENGGPTDLWKLLPLCVHHHTRIHSLSWQLT